MWNILEERCRTAQNILTNTAQKVILEKDIQIKELIEKLNILEDDFKYNLNLLKIRENENLRCQTEILNLNQILQEKNKEIQILAEQLNNANVKYENLERLYVKEKKHSEKLIFNLKATQNELAERQKIISTQRASIDNSNRIINELKSEIDNFKIVNMKLQTETKVLQREAETSQLISRNVTSVTSSKIITLKKELESIKKEFSIINEAKHKLLNEKNELIHKIEHFLQTMQHSNNNVDVNLNLTRINKELMRQIEDLKDTIKEISNQNSMLTESYYNTQKLTYALIHNRDEILQAIARFEKSHKRNSDVIDQFQKQNCEHCNDMDKLLKQNCILKEVVKKLKQERDEKCFQEQNLKELEDKVKMIKNTLLRRDFHVVSHSTSAKDSTD